MKMKMMKVLVLMAATMLVFGAACAEELPEVNTALLESLGDTIGAPALSTAAAAPVLAGAVKGDVIDFGSVISGVPGKKAAFSNEAKDVSVEIPMTAATEGFGKPAGLKDASQRSIAFPGNADKVDYSKKNFLP